MSWLLAAKNIEDETFLQEWSSKLEVSEDFARLLWSRGFRDIHAAQYFLNPSLQKLSALEDWPQLLEASSFLADALLAHKKVCVWGDYDVDGITSSALIISFLREHGFQVLSYIPDRLSEGYGLNKKGLEQLKSEGVGLLITVDNGISDIEGVGYAKKLGLGVIVSDHHVPSEQLPPADFVINPKLFDSSFNDLAGVGVAFFLMAATNNALAEKGRAKKDIRNALDLVALGTLADLVDLTEQNRILVKNGMLLINSGKRVGIAALKKECNFAHQAGLEASQILFTLAPRINAAGRMGQPKVALDLLLEEDKEKAAQLAKTLSDLNSQRKEEEEAIIAEAKMKAEAQVRAGKKILLVYSPDWHPGVIGIVASRLVESFNLPSIVLSDFEGKAKGSARSVGNFNLHEALTEHAQLLEAFGGHKMAAGLTVAPENIELLHESLNQTVQTHLKDNSFKKLCTVDGPLQFKSAADFYFLKELEMLQPFGISNREPTFYTRSIKIKNIVERNSLLRLELLDEESNITLQAKSWRNKIKLPTDMKGKYIHIAFTPFIDRYNGAASIEIKIKDWKPATEPLVIEEKHNT